MAIKHVATKLEVFFNEFRSNIERLSKTDPTSPFTVEEDQQDLSARLLICPLRVYRLVFDVVASDVANLKTYQGDVALWWLARGEDVERCLVTTRFLQSGYIPAPSGVDEDQRLHIVHQSTEVAIKLVDAANSVTFAAALAVPARKAKIVPLQM